jgi:acid phosphatase family membrane protein YuiD
MPYSYIATPFIAWVIAGSLKFVVNSLCAKKLAFGLIGYGGMPSNHATIVCSMASLIAFKNGLEHPALGVAITLAFIVMLDASSLRKQISKQAVAINALNQTKTTGKLRERIGHSPTEILAGACLGVVLGWLIASISF